MHCHRNWSLLMGFAGDRGSFSNAITTGAITITTKSAGMDKITEAIVGATVEGAFARKTVKC